MSKITSNKTALILIDLQNGIVNMDLAPYKGDEILNKCKFVAEKFRNKMSQVYIVNVKWDKNFSNAPSNQVDKPSVRQNGGMPKEWSEISDGVLNENDICITKCQWGAFYGTGLDLDLRRKGIDTLVVAGIATNFGVESTARFAWEYGYNVIILEDACSSFSTELHDLSIKQILPRISKIYKTDDLIKLLD